MQKGTLGEEGTGEKWRLPRRCLLSSSILQFGNIGGGREGGESFKTPGNGGSGGRWAGGG